MANRIDPMEVISQKSVGIRLRHRLFLNEYPDISIHKICRDAIDNQIKQLDSRYNEK